MSAVRVPRPVPYRSELFHTHLKASLFLHFLHDGLGRALVHVRPTPRERPAVVVRSLPHQQDAVVAEHSPTHVNLRRGIAGLLVEQHFKVAHLYVSVLGHDLRRQSTQQLVTLTIILIVSEGGAGLC